MAGGTEAELVSAVCSLIVVTIGWASSSEVSPVEFYTRFYHFSGEGGSMYMEK